MQQTEQPQTGLAVVEAETPKLSLNQLLLKMTEVDDGMLELSLDDQIELIDAGKIKVDNYKYFIDKVDAQAELFKKWEREFREKKQVMENLSKRIKDHMIWSMNNNGFKKFTGERYVVTIRRAKSSVVVTSKPTPEMMLDFSDLIRTKYEWEKDKIATALKTGNEDVAQFASFKENYSAKFEVNKGID